MRFILVALYALITLALTSRMAMALDPENRVLVPSKQAESGRSPAEAGLESGRYQEVEPKDLELWERKQNAALDKDQSLPAKAELPRKSEGQDFPASR